jgi:antitoxin component of RelBE/YafQ-DinJ toxin-antitoxin module
MKLNRDTQINLRVDLSTKQKLTRLVKHYNLSITDVLIILIRKEYEHLDLDDEGGQTEDQR